MNEMVKSQIEMISSFQITCAWKFQSYLILYFQCRKMVRPTLRILQQMLQDFWSVFDHFTTLRSKGLISQNMLKVDKNSYENLIYFNPISASVALI